MLLGMCCQLTFNQFMASLVNPLCRKMSKVLKLLIRMAMVRTKIRPRSRRTWCVRHRRSDVSPQSAQERTSPSLNRARGRGLATAASVPSRRLVGPGPGAGIRPPRAPAAAWPARQGQAPLRPLPRGPARPGARCPVGGRGRATRSGRARRRGRAVEAHDALAQASPDRGHAAGPGLSGGGGPPGARAADAAWATPRRDQAAEARPLPWGRGPRTGSRPGRPPSQPPGAWPHGASAAARSHATRRRHRAAVWCWPADRG
jgi:hypothetical protein